ncbi:hypothetical protein LPB86_14880 [Pedobacter sp. MC2016-14]|uniref:hypothetical protein n=1 Tax=Pedobacter sp. MC2016-14 TaxID=2897327 RepID=UPI001E37D102|nr:hypothetical protein [Pedobacter sp. MC2016-14]MCD0489524.1 hypothetical protein [Pedobacter sp. MC2016-14]
MEKLKLSLTFVTIIGIIAFGFYWISKDAERSESGRITAMSHGYKYSKGIITDIHSYKGKTVEVKYQIGSVYYYCKRNWDNNPRNLDVGDSIVVKYATKNPEFIVTELEDVYY